jgi:hypothetical protein
VPLVPMLTSQGAADEPSWKGTFITAPPAGWLRTGQHASSFQFGGNF